jgi:acetyl-CoA C-acetyltransferase
MWLEGHDIAGLGEGWKMVDSGATAMDGDFPVNPSGGVLSSNPIGASGMLRFAEAAMQVQGKAGEHQIDGAKLALAQAYGGAAQFYALWVVSSEL